MPEGTEQEEEVVQLSIAQQLEREGITRQGFIDKINEVIDLGAYALKMMESKEYEIVIENKFIKDFAITNAHNIAKYNEAGRARTIEKTIARSTFSTFMDGLILDAHEAKGKLKEFYEEEKQEELDYDEDSSY